MFPESLPVVGVRHCGPLRCVWLLRFFERMCMNMHMSKHRCPQRLEEALNTLQLVCGSCESPELGARILIQGLSKQVLITADPLFQYLWFKRKKKKV